MTGDIVFFDTAPFIYVVENHPQFGKKVINFITQLIIDNKMLATNVLVYNEFCVKPEQMGRQDIIHGFDTFLTELNFLVVGVNMPIAKIAYKLRAKYSFLRTIDSLQIASALHLNSSVFFTNDLKLKSIQEISVIAVSELP